MKAKHSWLQDRYSWLDDNGVPKKPRWKDEADAKALRLEAQHHAKHIELNENSIVIHAGEQEIFTAEAEVLQCHPRMREAVYTEKLKRLETTEVEAIGDSVGGWPLPDLRRERHRPRRLGLQLALGACGRSS